MLTKLGGVKSSSFSNFQRAPCGDFALALKKMLKLELFQPPYMATIFLPQIPVKLRCSYLGHFGSDLKSNGTFALPTLKMEELKVVLFFGLGLKGLRYEHSVYKHFYKLIFVCSLCKSEMITIAEALSY